MRGRPGRGDQWRRPGPEPAHPLRPRLQDTPTPSHLAGVLALQRSAGNAAVTHTLAVQRASDSDDSGLAYGSLPGPSRRASSDDGYDSDLAYEPPRGRDDTSFQGSVGGVSFATRHNGRLMQELSSYIRGMYRHFATELATAGRITVRFGRTQGGGVGEWRSQERTVMLDPTHQAVRRAGSSRLFGAAVFEILNASQEAQRAALDADARNGTIERQAAAQRMDPAYFYAVELERIEWRNSVVHRRIMADAGRSGTNADLFSADAGDFESYLRRQWESHSHSYVFRYSLLRAETASQQGSHGHQR
ncbi:hypothetical protein J7I94_10905 [Streptomyces sp. ISL-12]|uniref:hypothetical protein n=1 Tax=Streptomyces sp. ISL-12 TaxID=2819177 RepID=UPI001BED22D4|nr:hypothetical protein [Streptomyces sp. ISL-12]MBT2411067.1 hypothetical protein [Streptomyces sp. ISL-12]